MQSDGHVIKLSRDDVDNEMFHAATLSLGALGIIVSVTLQCERAFNLQQVQYSVPLKDVRFLLLSFFTARRISFLNSFRISVMRNLHDDVVGEIN